MLVLLYRYGFNGKEKDESGEWGSITNYDYGFRIYNPGIGRFLSVDPLSQQYPWYTPYQFAGNKPIRFIDIDGLEEGDHAYNFNWWEWVKEKFLDNMFGVGGNPSGANPATEENFDRRMEEASRFRSGGEDLAEGFKNIYETEKAALSFIPGVGFVYAGLEETTGVQSGSSEGLAAAGFWLIVDSYSGGLGSKAKPIIRVTKQYANDALEFTIKPLVHGLGRQMNQKIRSGTAKIIKEGGENILSLDFRIPKELGGKGVGSSMFEASVRHFEKEGIDAIEGLWVVSKDLYSDLPGNKSANLNAYREAVASGKSQVDAAFETFTGKQARKLGYTKAEVVNDVEGEVRFLFRKGKE